MLDLAYEAKVSISPSGLFEVIRNVENKKDTVLAEEDVLVAGSISAFHHNKFTVLIEKSPYHRIGQKLVFECIDEGNVSD